MARFRWFERHLTLFSHQHASLCTIQHIKYALIDLFDIYTILGIYRVTSLALGDVNGYNPENTCVMNRYRNTIREKGRKTNLWEKASVDDSVASMHIISPEKGSLMLIGYVVLLHFAILSEEKTVWTHFHLVCMRTISVIGNLVRTDSHALPSHSFHSLTLATFHHTTQGFTWLACSVTH